MENGKWKMENEEKPKTKLAQSLASLSWFSIGRKTFADLLISQKAETRLLRSVLLTNNSNLTK